MSSTEEAVFLGVDADSKGYWVCWPEKRRVSVEQNGKFASPDVLVDQDVMDEGESRPIEEISTEGVSETNSNAPSVHPIPINPDPAPNVPEPRESQPRPAP